MDQMQKATQYGKAAPVCCLVMAMSIQLGIMIPYMGLAGTASAYNEAVVSGAITQTSNALADVSNLMEGFADAFSNLGDGSSDNVQALILAAAAAETTDMPFYDLCGQSASVYATTTDPDTANAMLTGWTTTYKYNGFIYLILLIITALMMLCILIPGIPVPLITVATSCVGCFGIPLLAGGILAAVRRNSVAGQACALNLSPVDAEDATVTFMSNAASLSTLFVVQFIFLCFQQCCALCGGSIGQAIVVMGKVDDYQRM